MSHEPYRAEAAELIAQAQAATPVAARHPDVFRSPSGRITLTIQPWYDDDHPQMMRELGDIIEALQEMHRRGGGAQ